MRVLARALGAAIDLITVCGLWRQKKIEEDEEEESFGERYF